MARRRSSGAAGSDSTNRAKLCPCSSCASSQSPDSGDGNGRKPSAESARLSAAGSPLIAPRAMRCSTVRLEFTLALAPILAAIRTALEPAVRQALVCFGRASRARAQLVHRNLLADLHERAGLDGRSSRGYTRLRSRRGPERRRVRMSKEDRAAIVECQHRLAKEPRDKDTLLKLGDLHFKLEEFAEASRAWTQAADIYAEMGLLAHAIDTFCSAYEVIFMHAPHLTDDLDRIARRLAELYREDGDAGMVFSDFENWPRVYLDRRSSFDLHRRVIGSDPRSSSAHFLLAEAYALVGDREAAIAELTTAAALSRESSRDAEVPIIDLLLQNMLDQPMEPRARMSKEYRAAIVKCQHQLAKDPWDKGTLLKLGDLHFKLEEFAEASRAWTQAADIFAKIGLAINAIVMFVAVYEIVFVHAPHLTDDLDRIARRLAELYRGDGAAHTIHIDCQSWPRVRLHDRSGVDLHRRVIDIDPRSPRPHFLLAEAYALVGDREAAIAELKTAAALSLESGSDDEARVIDLVLKKMLDGPTE